MRDEKRIRVLLVEKDEPDARVTHNLLDTIAGVRFDVDWVCDCERAVEQLRTDDYHLLLLEDVGQGNVSLLHEAIWSTFNGPTLMLSASTVEQRSALAAPRAGAVYHLHKESPDTSVLCCVVGNALERKQLLDRLRSSRDRLDERDAQLRSA